MKKSTKRVVAVVWLVAVLGLGIFLITMRRPKPPVPTGPEANAEKLVGSGHMAALYRIVWPSGTTMPKWDPEAERALIQALPWKGIDKDSLTIAFHDPSATVDLIKSKPLQDGLALEDEVHDNAQHRETFGNRWMAAQSSRKTTYRFSVSGGYAHFGWLVNSHNLVGNGYGHAVS